jgi:hypothetical protein
MTAVHTAYARGSCAALRLLCRTFQQLKSSDVFQVVAAAVQIGYVPAVRVLLLEWPAIQLLEQHQAAALLRWAVGSSSSSSSSAGAAAVVGNGCVGYTHRCHPVPPSCSPACAELLLTLLCRLPAANTIGMHAMVGLLVFAMQQGNVEAVQQLCKLNSAAQLSPQCMRGLLRWAGVVGSRPGRDTVVGALCELRGAEGLKAADVGGLLQLYGGVDGLMGWTAAESQEAGVEPAEVRLTRVL